MSRQWTLAYVQTKAPVEELFAAVIRAARAELEGRIYGLAPGSYTHILYRDLAAVRFSAPQKADDVSQAGRRGIIVYPQKSGLYTLWVIRLLCQVGFGGGFDPVSRAQMATRLSDPEYSAAVCFPHFFAHLSRALPAEIAFVLFETNPSVDAAVIQFYKADEMVGDYYHLLLEGQRDTLCTPVDPAAIEDLFDGRFAFVLQPYRPWDPKCPDGPAHFFSPEDFGGRRPYDPESDAYNPEVSRLFVPFWEADLLPFGAIYLSE